MYKFAIHASERCKFRSRLQDISLAFYIVRKTAYSTMQRCPVFCFEFSLRSCKIRRSANTSTIAPHHGRQYEYEHGRFLDVRWCDIIRKLT